MAGELKKIKDIGWGYISLTEKNGFKGAVQTYLSENGKKVSLCFNTVEAFIIEDNLGLFTEKNLVYGVVRAKDIDAREVRNIGGAIVMATNVGTDVKFNEEDLTRLGINNDQVREDIKMRLFALDILNETVEVKI